MGRDRPWPSSRFRPLPACSSGSTAPARRDDEPMTVDPSSIVRAVRTLKQRRLAFRRLTLPQAGSSRPIPR
jgi:hypothetical protein